MAKCSFHSFAVSFRKQHCACHRARKLLWSPPLQDWCCLCPSRWFFNPSQSSVVLAVCFPPGWNHPVASGSLAPRPSAYLRCQWEQLVSARQSSSWSIQEPDQGGKRQTELLVHSSRGESSFLLLPSQERGTSLLISAVTQASGDGQPGCSCYKQLMALASLKAAFRNVLGDSGAPRWCLLQNSLLFLSFERSWV